MLRRLWLGGLAILVLGTFSLGCGSRSAIQRKQPRDPLLVTKKPITGGFRDQSPTPVRIMPMPPPVPEYDRGLRSFDE